MGFYGDVVGGKVTIGKLMHATTDSEMQSRMKKGWKRGLPETPCGSGATVAATARIRKWLPAMAIRYNIRGIVNAGAGVTDWMGEIGWPTTMQYVQHFDLVPRSPGVAKLDITKELLPGADAILCRFVLNHLDTARVMNALDLFKCSKAQYLIATQFDGHNSSFVKDFFKWDLRHNLGNPLERCPDGTEPECSLALWKL
jgi:hypothetical protein